MTWTQFKEKVEAQLQEKGISEDSDIWYIDISFPDEIDVAAGDPCGLAITT